MGVCFSCGPSSRHKAGSVCPLGCWNVHFGQQAASVLLNRSCPSYCTSRTMSLSLSVCLSLSFCLYDFMTMYRVFLMRDCTNLILDWCPCHCFSDAHLSTQHTRSIEIRLLISLLSPHDLVMQEMNTSHCRRGTISLGVPCECPHVCMFVSVYAWEKKGGDVRRWTPGLSAHMTTQEQQGHMTTTWPFYHYKRSSPKVVSFWRNTSRDYH